MKSKKDISDLIKANVYKLEERPSKKAWEQLESRLDQHARRRSFSFRQIISIAASIVGIAGITALITLSFQRGENDIAAEGVNAVEPFLIEAVENINEEEKGFYKVVEFQKKYQDRLSNPDFQEGKRKKITVANSSSATAN